jgi:hypothetical protein
MPQTAGFGEAIRCVIQENAFFGSSTIVSTQEDNSVDIGYASVDGTLWEMRSRFIGADGKTGHAQKEKHLERKGIHGRMPAAGRLSLDITSLKDLLVLLDIV